ncbi:MAG: peptidase M35, partial [Bacteroidota bacterium]|nr:peptidase M35 [Bacteroidota bacterium]
LKSIIQGFETTPFTYDLTGSNCMPGAYAATTKGGDTIWICTGFWNAPATGTDSKAGTLVHEHSHASAGTEDLGGYGRTNCQSLAATKPDDAIKNADNYEYFAGG